jgi:N-acetyl-beta-hexosaminidase
VLLVQLQLRTRGKEHVAILPSVRITDAPTYAWRGLLH